MASHHSAHAAGPLPSWTVEPSPMVHPHCVQAFPSSMDSEGLVPNGGLVRGADVGTTGGEYDHAEIFTSN